MGILVKSDKQALLNNIERMIPHRLDSKLWDSDEYRVKRGLDMAGVEFVRVSIFFLDFNERANFSASLGSIKGFIHSALPGSFIRLAKCYHNDLLPNGSPVKSDELEFEEVVT